ncbi:DUF6519 domain-containing protein [Pendulispora rubella]|uniref:DUF6519 domain-containing protein n=1 Tax=Pendulispora rubella TaxID=2741070 RepID=A0ABZ2LMM6_9BACT
MKGDFTRNTFDSKKHYSRVLLQQGRVAIDADWNEQASILLHHLRTLTEDLLGRHAGPAMDGGFDIRKPDATSSGNDFPITRGHYYVEGILIENEHGAPPQPPATPPPNGTEPFTTYQRQPDWWPKALDQDGNYFVYADVWERLITSVEDPTIREKALGGPDTAARAKVVWQVKARKLRPATGTSGETPDDALKALRTRSRGRMRAFVQETAVATDPCVIPPTSQYRGENQLWRIEVHRGGPIEQATFKVSLDNGSVIFPVVGLPHAPVKRKADEAAKQFSVRVAHLGRDERTTLVEDDWVELVDDRYALQSPQDGEWHPDALLRVVKVDAEEMTVTLEGESTVCTRAQKEQTNVLLRRWDHRGTEIEVVKDDFATGTFKMSEAEFHLADGIHIAFEKATGTTQHDYRPGDYWLIPAREAAGETAANIEWPEEGFVPPRGIAHHYAPLAELTLSAGKISDVKSLRTTFALPTTTPPTTPGTETDPAVDEEL